MKTCARCFICLAVAGDIYCTLCLDEIDDFKAAQIPGDEDDNARPVTDDNCPEG